MGNRVVPLVVAVSLGVLLLPVAASAQSSIAGVVKDASGAVLPGVQVEVSSPVLIEQSRTAITDTQGVFRVVGLRPGTYKVTFTLQGFSTFEREGIELPTGFTATVNAEMKLGSIAETITVSGEAPVVDVHTASQSQQVIPSEVRNAIPLSSNAAAFAALIPAATQAASDRDVGGIRGENSQAFSIHGSRTADMIMLRDREVQRRRDEPARPPAPRRHVDGRAPFAPSAPLARSAPLAPIAPLAPFAPLLRR